MTASQGLRALSAGVALFATAAAFGACRDRAPDPKVEEAAIERCEKGIHQAGMATDLQKASSIYHRECAGIHSQAGCRDAWTRASKAKQPDQMRIVVDGCRKAYCPVLGADKFEICKPDFEPTNEAIWRAWGPFHSGIVQYDAGKLEKRVTGALLRFYGTTQRLADTKK